VSQPSTPNKPSRYQRSTNAMVGAMIVTLAAVLVFVGWRALFRADVETEVEPVEWELSVGLAEEFGLTVVRPDALPEGWVATSVELAASDDPRWGMGLLTDDGDFVGIRQQDTSIEELVRTYVDDDADPGEPATVPSRVTDTWETWTDDGGDLGYSTELGDDAVLVYGSAPAEDIEEFIATLGSTG